MSDGSFLTTRWTRVVAARGRFAGCAEQALSDLCAVNYAPVLRFLRASGHDADEAQELAHEFFANVLEHRSLDGSDPERGRFRSYLLGALKHFVANRRVHGSRLKRGAGASRCRWRRRQTRTMAPCQRHCGRRRRRRFSIANGRWQSSSARSRGSSKRASPRGRGEVFQTLKPWLSASAALPAQADVAAQLGMSEGAVKVAIHRLRKRFREVIRREVAQTLHDPGELDAEMQHLIAALSR